MDERPLHVQFLTQNYPSPQFPERGAFVERLVRQWEERGHQMFVVAPDTWATACRAGKREMHAIQPAGEQIERSHYISVGNRSAGFINRFRITRRNFVRAAMRGASHFEIPDLYYGKFLFRGGEAALRLGRRNQRPSFADLGESWSLLHLERRSRHDAQSILQGLSGVVCVSARLRDEVIALGADPKRVLLAPNDVDRKRFFPRDRAGVRRELDLPEGACIVAFTGHFVERKGPLRVLQAIEKLDPSVVGVFLGGGDQAPSGGRVLHAGSVPNEEMPVWLSAADMFVLPTLGEGNCNAINEAIAVGLPIISSDIADVRGQVEPAFGILTDPMDVNAIAAAIESVCKDPEKRATMAAAAFQRFHGPHAESRAEKIMQFIRAVIAADSWEE